MIKINGVKANIKYFPDGTFLLKENVEEYILNQNTRIATFAWYFENNEELVALQFLAWHFRDKGMKIRLYMPYCPNARQDRIKNEEDVFTLKYFARIINSIGFSTVTILDPHSSVSEALIDNLIVKTPKEYIADAIIRIGKELTMFYPDEGSMKRYSGMIKAPYCFGVKKRDWKTGDILGLDIIGNKELIEGKDILIVDDICSKGGTFLHSAKKLKEMGAKDIYLYVTHCEDSIYDGELLNSGLLKKIYTTNSIYAFDDYNELIETICL